MIRAIVLALCVLASVARADGLVEPVAAAAYELDNTHDTEVVLVPLVLKPGATLASIQTLSVTVGSDAKPDLAGSFRPAIGDRDLALTIDVGKLDPATYVVQLSLSGTLATAAATQPVQVSFTLHPAQVRPIAAVVVDVERRWPWEDASPRVQVPLTNSSRKTRITHLVVEQDGLGAAGGAQTEARLVAKAPVVELAPGGHATVELDGSQFGLGITTGSIAISGRELDPQVAVAFEVHTRLVTAYIIGAFFVFGFLGWFMRRKLKKLEALAVFRAQIDPLVARYEEDRHTFTPDERRGLEAKVRAAQDAIHNKNEDAAQAAANALQVALEAAITNRDALLTAQQTSVDALSRAVRFAWRLPRLPTDKEIQQIQDSLDGSEPATAATKLVAVMTSLGEAMDNWLPRASAALKSALFADNPQLDTATKLVAAVPAWAEVGDGPYASYLTAAFQARNAVRALVTATAIPLVSAANALAARLLADHQAIPPAIASADTFAPGEDPEKDAATLTEVQQLVSKPQVAALLPEMAIAKIAVPATTSLVAPPVMISTPQRGSRPVESVAIARMRVVEIQLLRGVLSASILSLVAWIAFRGTWVGTVDDFVKVAVLAFFSDFTLDSVIDAVGKLRTATTS